MDITKMSNQRAEEAVIGSILIDYGILKEVMLILVPQDFAYTPQRTMYAAMLEMDRAGKPIDVLTLTWWLEASKRIASVGGSAGITDMLSVVPTHIHALHYALEILKWSIRRELVSVSQELVSMVYTNTDTPISKVMDTYEFRMSLIQERADQYERAVAVG
jgi:replicative DNA helicase